MKKVFLLAVILFFSIMSGIKVNAKCEKKIETDDFPIIIQNPELPTGCEITALTMVLNYYGYPADKIVMAPVLFVESLHSSLRRINILKMRGAVSFRVILQVPVPGICMNVLQMVSLW